MDERKFFFLCSSSFSGDYVIVFTIRTRSKKNAGYHVKRFFPFVAEVCTNTRVWRPFSATNNAKLITIFSITFVKDNVLITRHNKIYAILYQTSSNAGLIRQESNNSCLLLLCVNVIYVYTYKKPLQGYCVLTKCMGIINELSC
jgi:hypothetical protein